MILVDTSVWVDHFKVADGHLVAVLGRNQVSVHPWVVGELLLGGLRPGSPVMELLPSLQRPSVANDGEITALIRSSDLAGSGIGWVDAALLASARLSAPSRLWTRDQRLHRAAERCGVAYVEPGD